MDANIEQFDKSVRSVNMRELVKRYFVARAYAELKRERIDAIGDEVLSRVCLIDRYNGKRITAARNAWTAEDSSWREYHDECVRIQLERKERPNELDRDYCPALMAESELMRIEQEIVRASCEGFGGEAFFDHLRYSLKTYKQWLDNVIGAAVSIHKIKSSELMPKTA